MDWTVCGAGCSFFACEGEGFTQDQGIVQVPQTHWLDYCDNQLMDY